MNDVLARVRAHLGAHFAAVGVTAEPTSASVTFLGLERMDVLRFGSTPDGGYDYVSLGCSRYPMADPTAVAADPSRPGSSFMAETISSVNIWRSM